MSSLGDKMRKAREYKREVDGFTLIIRRPTRVEFSQFANDGASFVDFAHKFVVGWHGVTEADLVVSGASDAVEFDRDAWIELHDNTLGLLDVGELIVKEYTQHIKDTEDREKN